MLHLHRSERADCLVDGLADVLREPPADPFAPEVVAVPARGVERWVTQRLSHVLGTSLDEQDGVVRQRAIPAPVGAGRGCPRPCRRESSPTRIRGSRTGWSGRC